MKRVLQVLNLWLLPILSIGIIEVASKPAFSLPARMTAAQWGSYLGGNSFVTDAAYTTSFSFPTSQLPQVTLVTVGFLDGNEVIHFPGQTVYSMFVVTFPYPLISAPSVAGAIAVRVLGESSSNAEHYSTILAPAWTEFNDYILTDWRGEESCSSKVQLTQSLAANLCIGTDGNYYVVFF